MKHLTFILVVLACASCTQQTQPPPQAKTDGPVIVRIVSRNQTITARAGANGPVYSVTTADGEQVVPAMNLRDMQAQHPDPAKKIGTMQADSRMSVWAGVE